MRKWILLAMALALVSIAFSATAVTDLSLADYEALVSTYSIDKSIPAYDEYLQRFASERPDARIILEASEYVRYEEEGVDTPTILSDYDGTQGDSLLTGEEALVE